MLKPVIDRLVTLVKQVATASPGPNAIPCSKICFEDSPMTRQRLNELLAQTPSLPIFESKEPVQLS